MILMTITGYHKNSNGHFVYTQTNANKFRVLVVQTQRCNDRSLSREAEGMNRYHFVVLENVTERRSIDSRFPFCYFYWVVDMIKANKRVNNVCILSNEAYWAFRAPKYKHWTLNCWFWNIFVFCLGRASTHCNFDIYFILFIWFWVLVPFRIMSGWRYARNSSALIIEFHSKSAEIVGNGGRTNPDR